MTFQEFLNQYNGQVNVGNTPENKGQCVGLVAVWVDALGYDHIWGNAKDLPNNHNPNQFDFILNTPDAIPTAGDIICWNGNMGGGYGHTAIATGTGTKTTVEVFEQNNPTGSNCHLRTYPNYNNIIGWLRPKPISVSTSADYFLGIDLNNKDSIKVCVQTWKDVTDGKYVKKEDCDKLVQSAVTPLKQTIADKEATISNLNGQIAQLEKDKNLLADELKVCQSTNQSNSGLHDNLIQTTQELNQLKLNYEKAKGDWGLKEVGYNKQIALLTTKYTATKSSLKKLLIDYIFGKK